MSIYLWIILAYLLALTTLNFIRSRRIKSQDARSKRRVVSRMLSVA